jgi:hypothetical protein
MTRSALSSTVLAILIVPLGRQPSAQCPTDSLIVCDVITTTSAPSYAVNGCTNAGAAYNLVAAHLAAEAPVRGDDAALTTKDIYTILGPASVSPIACGVRFAIVAHGVYAGSVDAQIRSATAVQGIKLDAFQGGGGSALNFTLSLSEPHPVGEPFLLVLSLHAHCPIATFFGETQWASGTGDLFFDVPPGYLVTSCQGYSSLPTAAKRRSWGELKTLYR